MEEPTGAEEVVAVATDVPWRPSERSGQPMLFQSDERAVLIFDIGRPVRAEGALKSVRRSIYPKSTAVSSPTGARAEIRFEDCASIRYGFPAFDALAGHSLHLRGLESCGLFEVVNSLWLQELTVQHEKGRPGDTWPVGRLRHLVATFPSATFECLCRSIMGRATDLPVPEIFDGLFRTAPW